MKILCETTGEFELVDYDQSQLVIQSTRPTVAKPSTFISTRAAVQQVRILGNLSDEATDEEFANYIKESGDLKLAISSFLEAFAVPDASTERQESMELPVATKRGRNARLPDGT